MMIIMIGGKGIQKKINTSIAFVFVNDVRNNSDTGRKSNISQLQIFKPKRCILDLICTLFRIF